MSQAEPAPKNETSKKQCIIQVQATPYAVELKVPAAEVNPELAQIWEMAKKVIPANGWDGFRPGSDAFRPLWETKMGGLTRAYSSAWASVISAACAAEGKFVLDIAELAATRLGDDFGVAAQVYFVPHTVFSGPATGPDDTIPVDVYSMHPEFIENMVDQRLVAIRHKFERFGDVDSPIAEGMKATIDLVAQLDGEPWPDGTLSGHEVLAREGSVFPDELYKNLLGKKVGDEFSINQELPKVYGPNAGKKLSAQVRVCRVASPISETMGELLKRAGYESEVQATEALSQQVKEEMLADRERVKVELALHKLRSQCTISPIPMNWLRTRAQEHYKGLAAQNPKLTEQQLLAQHGAEKPMDLIRTIMIQVADLFRDEIVMLGYAGLHGKLDYSLPLDKNYEIARAYVISRIVMNEVEPLSVRKKADAKNT